jgi:hypothetical protein
MASHDRNLLKTDDILAFQRWMDENKLPWRKGKGEFELMQVKLSRGWAAIFTNTAGAVTTPAALREMIARFKKGLPYTGQTPRSQAQAEGADFLNDLLDDIAMRVLPSLLIDAYHTRGSTPEAMAESAYDIADAMLAERAKRLGRGSQA